MNSALLKNGVRRSWRLFALLAAVLTMYYFIIVAMFDPKMGELLAQFEQYMPQLMSMVGMSGAGSTLVSFMANYLYGFVMLVVPMVYAIFTANRLVAKHVDSGSMACLLAAPVSRRSMVATQMAVLTSGITLLVGYATLAGIAASAIFFPGELDIKAYLVMNLGALALQLFIGGICFAASCLFNDTKYSIGFGAGVPFLFFLVQMIANAGTKFSNAKYLTFFTLFNPRGITYWEPHALWGIGVLAAGAFVLFAAAALVFTRKDMPV